MSDLFDRFHDPEQLDPPRPAIASHLWVAMVKLYLSGKVTGAEMIAAFDLQGDELTQATAIRNVADAKNTTGKIVYASVVEGVFSAINVSPEYQVSNNPFFNADGSLNKTRIASVLEITL